MKLTLLIVLLVLVHHALGETKPLMIVAEDYAPATFLVNGEPAGYDVDIARSIFAHLGVNCTFLLVPWPRAYYMLKNGQADVGLHVSITEERAQYLRWPTTAVWNADFVFMTTQSVKSRYDIKSYEDTKRYGLSIGITQNNAYFPTFWKAYPSPNRENQEYNKQLDPASDAATNFRKLAAGRIQLFPFPIQLGNYMKELLNLKNITNYDWVIFSKPYPNAFSKASKFSNTNFHDIDELMQAYDKELARIKSDRAKYNQFFDRYKRVDHSKIYQEPAIK